MNPAEILRRASKLMMVRAHHASPGPWHVAEWHDMHWITGSDENGPITLDCSEAGIALDPDRVDGGRDDAEHIASWSPPVAIMVARWLHAEAEVAETMGENYMVWSNTIRGYGALTVATTYLGITREVFGDMAEVPTPVHAPWSWN